MTNEFEEAFAQLYCKEKGIKPSFCEASVECNSSYIKVRYRVEGESVRCDIVSTGYAFDLMAKHVNSLDERLKIIERKFVL
jgi:hypothetical protein